jgi:hypothetical protein
LRGSGANVIILEEAAYVADDVFFEVVVPLLGMNNTAVLAISTPSDESNYYSVLTGLTRKDSDEPLFLVLQVGTKCEDCIAAQREECPHTKNRLPSWKSTERQAMTEQIMKGNVARMNRELHGVVGSQKQFLFRKYITKMTELAPYRWKTNPTVLHLAVDPSGGGASDYAYSLLGYEEGYNVIIGFCGLATVDPNDALGMFRSLFVQLRRSPRYQSALVVIYVESNHGPFDAKSLMGYVDDNRSIFGPVEFQNREEKKEVLPGVITTHNHKEMFANLARHELANGHVLFADEMIGVPERLVQHKAELLDQFRNYHKDIKLAIEPGFGTDKVTYTGKTGGKRDDMCMAFQIGLYHMHAKRDDDRFVARCRNEGRFV